MNTPKTVDELYSAIIKHLPEGPGTQNALSVTGEPYIEWALGVYTKEGFDGEAFLCGKFLDHIFNRAEGMGHPEDLTVYFRIKPECVSFVIDNPEHSGHGRAVSRLYVRYLLTDNLPSAPPYPDHPRQPDIKFVEYLEAP